jgi:hypothetical protein
MSIRILKSWLSGSDAPTALPKLGPNTAHSVVVRQVTRYLNRRGWVSLEPVIAKGVWIRARRDELYLNLALYEPTSLSWATQISDLVGAAKNVRGTLGILTLERTVHESVRRLASDSGLFVLTLPELQDIEAIVQTTISDYQERKRKALSLP